MSEVSFVGSGGRSPLDGLIGRSGVTAGTTYIYPDRTVDLSSAGMPDLTPKAASLDGMCWIAERDNGDQYAFTIAWNDQSVPYVHDCQLLAGASEVEPIIQTGIDWILTRKFFLARRDDNWDLYKLQVRDYPLRFPDEELVPPDMGLNVGLSVRKESDWLYFSGDDRIDTTPDPESGEMKLTKNPPPFWERLNPVVGGYTILHDCLVPRQDYGRPLYTRGGEEGRDWSRVAIPYFVYETFSREAIEREALLDLPSPHWFGGWFHTNGRYAERGNKCSYAVFVIDGELYVRTMSFLGTGRFMRKLTRLGPDGITPYAEIYALCNMADLGIWRKNYQQKDDPGKTFDWNNSCMGKIGKTLVLFECAESERDPLTLGPMRIAATGRYIPITGKVAYSDNPDGTSETHSPPMKCLTDAEAEELQVSLSVVTKAEDNKAYGYTPEPKEPLDPNVPPKPDSEYMLRAYQLDENGEEYPPNITVDEQEADLVKKALRPAYKGVRNHFAVGGNPLTGAIGPYVCCNDDSHVFMTDTTGDLQRFVREGRIRPVAYQRTEMWNTDLSSPNDLLYEEMNIFNARRGAIDIYVGNRVVSEIPWIEWYDYAWEQKCIEPHAYRLLQAVIGTDVLDGALPAWNIPMMFKHDSVACTLTYAWINPETGAVDSPIIRSYQERESAGLYVTYDAETEYRRVYLSIYNPDTSQTTEDEIMVPPYLDGWIGMSDLKWSDIPATASAVHADNEHPMYDERVRNPFGKARYAPTIDPMEKFTICHRYFNVTANGGLNGAYIAKGASLRDAVTMNWNHDANYFHLLSLWNNEIITGMIADGLVYIPNTDTQNFGTTPRAHHVNNAYWESSAVTYPVQGVFMAHYVKGKFLMEPTRWTDELCAIPFEQYRYQKELVVMKCRMGESDQPTANPFPGSPYPWSQHRYLAYRIDTDPAVYSEIIKPLALRPGVSRDSDFVD